MARTFLIQFAALCEILRCQNRNFFALKVLSISISNRYRYFRIKRIITILGLYCFLYFLSLQHVARIPLNAHELRRYARMVLRYFCIPEARFYFLCHFFHVYCRNRRDIDLYSRQPFVNAAKFSPSQTSDSFGDRPGTSIRK